MKKKTNKDLFVWMAVIISTVLIAVTALAASYMDSTNQNDIVATVNGEPVTFAELSLFAADQRAKVTSYFQRKYGVEDSSTFWTTPHGGESPIEMVKRLALEQLTKVKIEQALMRDHGIITDTSYQTFLKQLEEENKRREEYVRKNRVIYGPIAYSPKQYYEYLHSNRVVKLMEKLSGDGIVVTPDELNRVYQAEREAYKRPVGYQVQVIEATLDHGRSVAEKLLTEITARLKRGDDFNEVGTAYVQDNPERLKLITKEFEVASSRINEDQHVDYAIRQRARQLGVGQISDMIETPVGLSLIKVLEVFEHGYTPLEEVEAVIRMQLVGEKYKKLVERDVLEAVVDQAAISISRLLDAANVSH